MDSKFKNNENYVYYYYVNITEKIAYKYCYSSQKWFSKQEEMVN